MNGATLGREDFDQIASLHLKGIDSGFLSQLGVPFLSLLYESMSHDVQCFLEVERFEGKVIGFVCGTLGSLAGVRRRLLMNPIRLTAALLPTLISLARLKKLAETVVHTHSSKPLLNCPSSELLSIVVDPAGRGRGAAQRLYAALSARFSEAGVSSFCIVVGEGLGPAHRFYQKMGGIEIGKIEVHKGQQSSVYVQQVDKIVTRTLN